MWMVGGHKGWSQGPLAQEGGENDEKIFLGLNVQYEREIKNTSKFVAWTTRRKKLHLLGWRTLNEE